MPQKVWAVGEEVLAADFNSYVQNQVVPTFATAAARDSGWAAPPNGALAVTTDTNTLWQRRAGAWTYAQPRTGFSGTLTNQAIGTGVVADLLWTTEVYDTDAFHAPSAAAIVIPAGLAGVYTFGINVDANGTLNGGSYCSVVGGASINFVDYIPTGNRYGSTTATFECSAGASIKAQIYNGHTASVNWTARLTVARVSV